MTRFTNSQGALLSDDEVASAIRFWEDHAAPPMATERCGYVYPGGTFRCGLPENAVIHWGTDEAHPFTPPYRPATRVGLPAAAGVTGAPAAADIPRCFWCGEAQPTTSGPPRSPVAVAGHPGDDYAGTVALAEKFLAELPWDDKEGAP